MYISSFPGCCAADVIVNFGGGHRKETENFTKQQVIAWVKVKLSQLKNRKALIFAIPTSTQPNARAALEELGFYTAPDYKTCSIRAKGGHKIYPFFMPLQEWDEVAFDARYNPAEDTYKNKKNIGLNPFDVQMIW